MTDYAGPRQRHRIRFAKGEALKHISHLDLARTWERAFRRARLPLAYSMGFNPRPRFHIAAALPVGVTGRAEYLDIWLDTEMDSSEIASRLAQTLPGGLEVLGVGEIELRAPSLQSQMSTAEYRAVIHTSEPVEAIATRVRTLLEAPALPRQRQHKGRLQSYDLRPLIHGIEVTGGEGEAVLGMCLQSSPGGAGRPDEVLDALGLSIARHSIERTKLHFVFDK